MKIKNICLLFLLVFLSSCFKDETTHATGAISEISIVKGSIKSIYDIDKNATLVITPQILQTNVTKALSYTWEIDQEIYSNDSEFVFYGNKLGTFDCRLIVENEDGKTFFPFKLNVNSPYEEGITVISHDTDGKSMLSFMLKQRDEGVKDFFIADDCFTLNNPEESFVSNVTDIIQCGGSLLIACKGDATKGEGGTIYYLNEKTFVIENILKAPEYEDFRPYRMLIPENSAAGTSYPILCENGKVYEFSTSESAVVEPKLFKSNYSLCSALYDSGTASWNYIYLWDFLQNQLSIQYNGRLYYCSKEYLNDPSLTSPPTNYFAGYDFVFMFVPKSINAGTSPYHDQMVVITKKGAMYQSTLLYTGFWQTNMETLETGLGDYGGMKLAGMKCDLTPQTPYVATHLYNALYYAKQNQILRMNYSVSMFLNSVKKHSTVGSSEAVITAMELSQDHLETYVAFYEPNESGLNGHVWVIETETGEILRKYDNVCYRPTKIIYKKK